MTQRLRALTSAPGGSRPFPVEVLAMNRSTMFRRAVFGFALAGVATLISTARPALADDRAPRPGPEVYAAACTSKAEGTACSVTQRGREMHGICAADRRSPQLACRPSPPRPR